MDVVLCRLNRIATDGAGLRRGFRSFRAGSVILRIAMSTAKFAKVGVVQITASSPLAGVRGVIFCNLQIGVAANSTRAFRGTGSCAAHMVFRS